MTAIVLKVLDAVILALFDLVAWALNHTPKEPW